MVFLSGQPEVFGNIRFDTFAVDENFFQKPELWNIILYFFKVWWRITKAFSLTRLHFSYISKLSNVLLCSYFLVISLQIYPALISHSLKLPHTFCVTQNPNNSSCSWFVKAYVTMKGKLSKLTAADDSGDNTQLRKVSWTALGGSFPALFSAGILDFTHERWGQCRWFRPVIKT